MKAIKAKAYLKALTKLVEQYPNAMMVYATDDEGNGYDQVQFTPTLGNFDKRCLDFTDKDTLENEYVDDGQPINAICVN